MLKRLAVSAWIILLLSSAAVAFIDQNQDFVVGNTNGVLAVGLNSTATGVHVLTTAQHQLASTPGGHVTVYQGTVGSLIQSAGSLSISGAFGVEQGALGLGTQSQSQDGSRWDLGNRNQFLDADLAQTVVGDGRGAALALQSFLGFQTQLTFTTLGAAANVRGLGVAMFDAVAGLAGGPAGTIASGGADLSLAINAARTP